MILGFGQRQLETILFASIFSLHNNCDPQFPKSNGNGASADYTCRYCWWDVFKYLVCGYGHTYDPNSQVVWGSSEVIGPPDGQDMHNWSLYPHTLMDFHGTWTKEYWSWVHMWPNYCLDAMISCLVGTYFTRHIILSLPCYSVQVIIDISLNLVQNSWDIL